MQLSQVNEQLQQFYAQYPFTHFQQLQDELKNIEQQTYQANNELSTVQQFIRTAEDKLRQIRSKIETNKELQKYYNEKVQKLLTYEKVQQDIEQQQLQQTIEESKQQALLVELQQLQQQYEDVSSLYAQTKERLTDMESQYRVLQAERSLYKKVLDVVPIFSDVQYDVLAKQERKSTMHKRVTIRHNKQLTS